MNPLFPHSRIMIFSKAPVPGEVKTRLIPAYGKAFATELHQAMLWHNLTVLSEDNLCPIELWCSQDVVHPFFDSCASTFGVTRHTQQGADLGEKMQHAFKQVLTRADNAVVIGTDCPTLTTQDYITAFDGLNHGIDAVIGPAKDGGYVLLGLGKAEADLFSGIDWGSTRVFAQTKHRLAAEQLSWSQLGVQRDIDTPDDMEYLLANMDSLDLREPLRSLLLRVRAQRGIQCGS